MQPQIALSFLCRCIARLGVCCAFRKHTMSDEKFPSPDEFIPIPDEHYIALGKVADAWADFEFEIDQMIWELMRTPQTFGACVTAQMISGRPRFRALKALVRLYEVSDPLIKRLNTISSDAGSLA